MPTFEDVTDADEVPVPDAATAGAERRIKVLVVGGFEFQGREMVTEVWMFPRQLFSRLKRMWCQGKPFAESDVIFHLDGKPLADDATPASVDPQSENVLELRVVLNYVGSDTGGDKVSDVDAVVAPVADMRPAAEPVAEDTRPFGMAEK